ncbi:lysylphosphatidylglycerol synthase transmembrane domain-containing protein [Natrononativus amylolyticus]|uniref:lysylphosphatidylglycerol synthase transmembrane domain-containing protein n=1 Tax=Natrononativus amylolyticus TaxID=2963434 RepID=UPI0020CC4E3B|nr:lysylphosphatidylglycerol synthase transmembrane domain-containing protein [Natrononativus amylolyticus]
MQYRRAAIGLTLALAVVGLLVYGVGWEQVLANVRQANAGWLAVALLAGLGILALRGLLVERLLVPIEGAATGVAFVAAFLSGYFARSALPWGRSTGTPITAYLLAANSDSEFEDNLAVVATAEVFGFLASVVVALVGLAAYTAIGETPADLLSSIALAGGAGVLVAGTVVAVAYQGWARTASFALARRWERVAARVPRLPGADGGATDRVSGFFDTLETVKAARRTLVTAFGVALVSWVVNALPLYFCLLALGVDAPIVLALALAPLASFGGVLPLPGGTGGIEVVLAGLLVTVAGLTGDLATATALLYRLTTYWPHLVVGGMGAVYLSLSGSRTVTV